VGKVCYVAGNVSSIHAADPHLTCRRSLVLRTVGRRVRIWQFSVLRIRGQKAVPPLTAPKILHLQIESDAFRRIPGTYVQYPGLQGAGALGDA